MVRGKRATPFQSPSLIALQKTNAMIKSVSSRKTSRREFMAAGGKLVAVSALAGVALPHVHAAGDNTIRLAIVGCGGRGTGAVGNACEAENGPVKLVAMADLFE